MKYFIFFFTLTFYMMQFVYADRPCYTTHLYKITNSFNKQMEKSKGFKCSGGGGSFPTDIRSVYLSYWVQAAVDIPEARIVFIEAVEELTKRINADPKVRPYLHVYPFPPSNVEISIGYEDTSHQFISNGKVAHVFQAHGIVFYRKHNMEKDALEPLYKEPYEEALRIVQAQKQQKP